MVEALSDSSGSQNMRPKPRLVHNSAGNIQQIDSDDTFNLHSRIYPPCAPIVEETTTTLSPASTRLVAAEEGLISKKLEGCNILGSTHPSDASLEGPAHQVTHPLNLPPASYDGTNPFVPRPPPERPSEQLPWPGLGMHPPYSQQPDVGQANNHMQYNMNSNTGWYTSRHGPYPPLPYHYHPAYPPPNPHGPMHPQLEHPDHNAPPQLHDTHYNGMVGGNDLYHRPYPPHPPPAHPGPISRPDGHENPLPGAPCAQNDSGGDEEMHAKGTNLNG